MKRWKDIWDRWKAFALLIGPTWGVSTLLFVGIMLWGWPPVLIFVVPIVGFPIYGMVLDWLTSDARRAKREHARLERRHHRAASAH